MTVRAVGEDVTVQPTTVPEDAAERVVRHTDVSRLLGIGRGPVWIACGPVRGDRGQRSR